jgi:hypothetical protein
MASEPIRDPIKDQLLTPKKRPFRLPFGSKLV